MKKCLTTFAIVLYTCSAFCQKDPELVKRLHALMQVTQSQQFEKVMEYTYPKVFTIAPRAKMLEAFKNSTTNDELIMRFDSLKVDSLYPVFSLQAGKYA